MSDPENDDLDEFDGENDDEPGDINEDMDDIEDGDNAVVDDIEDADADLGDEEEDDPLTCPTRSHASVRAILDSDHDHDLFNRLHRLQSSTWFYQADKVNAHTQDLFREPTSAQFKSQKWGHPELRTVHHVRPLQWYGCRFHSLSTGRTAVKDQIEDTGEDGWDDIYEEIKADMQEDVWTVATFAILDANSRAFPLMLEWNHSSGFSSRGFIYTCKRSEDSEQQQQHPHLQQPGPDICIGRVSRAVGADYGDSVVTIDMDLLRSALPNFAAIYAPHGLADTARAHASLAAKVFFHTSIGRSKKGPEPQVSFPVPESFGLNELTAAIDAYDIDTASNNPNDLFSHVQNGSHPLAEWLTKLRQFYATLSPEELLRNQLEIMCAAAVATLFERVPNHLFTENQPTELRQRLTVEALSRLSPQQAKAFTSAALPPLPSTKTLGESASASQPFNSQKTSGDGSCASSSASSASASVSHWPHADIVWGPADTRPLPNELIRLIAEYSLDELELMDLPWIPAEEDADFDNVPIEGDFWREGHLIYGVIYDNVDEGDDNIDDYDN